MCVYVCVYAVSMSACTQLIQADKWATALTSYDRACTPYIGDSYDALR